MNSFTNNNVHIAAAIIKAILYNSAQRVCRFNGGLGANYSSFRLEFSLEKHLESFPVDIFFPRANDLFPSEIAGKFVSFLLTIFP